MKRHYYMEFNSLLYRVVLIRSTIDRENKTLDGGMHVFTSNIATTEAPFSMRSILGPLVAIVVGIFMVILDGTAVNVAFLNCKKNSICRTYHSFNGRSLVMHWHKPRLFRWQAGYRIVSVPRKFSYFRRSLHNGLRAVRVSELR